jgi:DNA-binding MarR family transcriptional regulator
MEPVRAASVNPPDLDELAFNLVQQASMLTRLVYQHAHLGVPRSEAGILARLAEAPMRIGALAEAESLAQPTVTLVVKRLEQQRLVERRPDPEDGRATLISLTEVGLAKLTEIRSAYRAFLRGRLARLPEADLEVLARALAAMTDLIEVVQDDEPDAAYVSRTILPSLPPAAKRS